MKKIIDFDFGKGSKKKKDQVIKNVTDTKEDEHDKVAD
jgi:hypothetical protein